MPATGHMAGLLPVIDPEASKYSRGSLLVMGGSARYRGAPVLAALASARSGTGYTSVLVPESMAQTAMSRLLSIPVMALPDSGGAEGCLLADAVLDAVRSFRHVDCIVLGPGMLANAHTALLCRRMLEDTEVTLVMDADALNCISGLDLPEGERTGNPVAEALRCRSAPVVLTPHDGELKRLAVAAGVSPPDLPSGREGMATALSEFFGCTVVAKGRLTVVASSGSTYVSENGTPALAKAGTGDVLAGMIGAFVAQRLPVCDACRLAVLLHGMAGKAAEKRLDPLSVMAEDVVDRIPEAIRMLRTGCADADGS